MKKLFSALLTLTVLLGLALPAAADVIWEPMDDTFYETHQDEFTYAGFYAYTNGSAGQTEFYAKPDGPATTAVENGLTVFVQYIYTDTSGSVWAFITDDVYIPMEQLLNRYDDEFLEEHAEVFDTASPRSFTIPEDAPLLLWTYPHGRYTQAQNYWGEDIVSGLSAFYVDENDLVWGYISYWYGHWNAWICLSDYNNPDLAESEHLLGECHWTASSGLTQSIDFEDVTPIAKETLPETLLPILLPLAAAVLAVVLLILRARKKA